MSFVLGDIEQQALRSAKELHKINEYGLKGLNIVRIDADGVVNPSDAQLTFTIDSSKLAGNIMLNRIQMEIEYEVVAKGSWAAAPFTAGAGFNTAVTANNALGYLMSPSNGAMDALCGNKSFSSIELSNKQVQLVQDSRNPEKIDILSRLLSPQHLNESGVYLDNTYGSLTDKAGGQWELQTLTDNTAAIEVFGRACSLEDIEKNNLFWKRNTNKQYITKNRSTIFKDSVGASIASANPPAPFSNFKDGDTFWYDWASTAGTAGSTQTSSYIVKEDVLHDIFVSQYQEHPVYMGFPTSDLVLTFTKSNILNSLYKTSNSAITGIDVTIKNMKLNILTYNYGLIDLPIKDYYIPFYSETVHQQTVSLSTDPDKLTALGFNKDKVMQTRQYNSVPEYFVIYCQEPNSSGVMVANKQNALKPAKVVDLKLQIDNETSTPLYNMNIDELKYKTLTNLADSEETVEALFRAGILPASGLSADIATFYTTRNWTNTNLAGRASGKSAGRSFLDGLFVLKCGKDIRLPADMVVGQDRKVSFTFTVSFDTVSNSATPISNNSAQCQFIQIAYFPSMYKFSPTAGLLKAERFVLSDNEFRSLVNATNNKVNNNTYKNDVYFTSQHPLMVGSGFGNLFSWARSKVPVLKNVAKTVGDVADVVSKGSKMIHEGLGGKKTRAKVGRPKRKYA
ncbi:hypothetical protein EKK58_04345 [Candidatus Dependentiae bacterium]|nr:MAG: hypothetical protein EKK58_04345 [Candidatus Dependentiae bacterium]